MRLLVFLLGLVVVLALGLGGVPIHFDEAQYATWLAAPDLSYQTKGPLVTFAQSLTHFEFFPHTVQVRLPAWLAWSASGGLLLWLANLAGFERIQSVRLFVLYATSPLLLVLGAVHSTDIWLLFFILLALVAFASILHCRPNQQTELWWMLMGGALGLGALAKLSIALVPIGLMPWVISRAPRLIFTPGPFLGALFCIFCISPWIIWNEANEFAHLAHEFGHVDSKDDSIVYIFSWMPELLITVAPLMLMAIFGGFSRRIDTYFTEAQDSVREMLLYTFATLIILFMIKGGFGKILLNWTLPLVPFLLFILADRLRWSESTVTVVGLGQIAILIALLFPYGLGLTMKQDLFQKLRGWDRTIELAAALAGPSEVVTSDHYSTLAWALYHWPSDTQGVERYQTPLGQVIPSTSRRRNHYDNWGVLDQPHAEIIHIGVYSETLARRCKSFNELGEVSQVMPDGTIRSKLGVYRCRQFIPNPTWPEITDN